MAVVDGDGEGVRPVGQSRDARVRVRDRAAVLERPDVGEPVSVRIAGGRAQHYFAIADRISSGPTFTLGGAFAPGAFVNRIVPSTRSDPWDPSRFRSEVFSDSAEFWNPASANEAAGAEPAAAGARKDRDAVGAAKADAVVPERERVVQRREIDASVAREITRDDPERAVRHLYLAAPNVPSPFPANT